MSRKPVYVKYTCQEDSVVFLVLSHFEGEEWKPSMNLVDELADNGVHIEREVLMRTLQALSSPRLREIGPNSDTIDLRFIEKEGVTSSAKYRLTALGRRELETLRFQFSGSSFPERQADDPIRN